MKKLFLPVIMCLLAVASLYSQALDVNFGSTEYTMPKGHDFVRLVGGDSRTVFALRMDDKNQLYLDQFDANSMQQLSTGQLTIPSVGGIQGRFVDLFLIDGKLILFTEVLNNTIKQKDLYAQFINDQGKIMGESKIVGRLLEQNVAVDFNVKLSSDGQYIFAYYNQPFVKYNEEKFFIKVFGSDLEVRYEESITLPMNNLVFDIIQYETHKLGYIYMIAEITPEKRNKRSNVSAASQFKLIIYDVNSDKAETFDIKAEKYELANLMMGVDFRGDIDIYGLLTRKGKVELEGIYHKKFEIENRKFLTADAKKAYYTFKREELPEFRNPRVSERFDQVYNYAIKNVLYLANESSVVIMEHQNYWVDSTPDPQTKAVSYHEYTKFNDIIVACTNSKNNMEWMRRIPKSQKSYNDFGKYSSFYATTNLDWVLLMYNDNPKNIKNLNKKILDGSKYANCFLPDRTGNAVVVSVFADGDVIGYPMFEKKQKKNIIVPEMVKRYGDSFFAYTQRGVKYKFAAFTILLRQ